MLSDSRRTPIAPSSEDLVEQELEDFSYMVSHDLAASFRHVSEFSRLLVSDLGDTLSPRQRNFADKVQIASGRCNQMMEQLLVFSRAQQKDLVLEPLNATQLMRGAALRLSSELHAANAELEIGQLGHLVGDADLISLALHHLLDNAIKFRDPSRPLEIHVSAESTRTLWALRISDNGIGVDPDYFEKAFKMFQRLHADGAYPGVGAGLPLCRRIARRHGGDAGFLEQKQGACVELIIPVTEDIH